ncbi:hypothetical protein CFBP4996_08575 [Agrobacterium leguminum]|uniref:Uncharacterized protein n=1 Tax=Agrobacterium deltaense NCPPB 1641 TaxID=1183425 RepID=A0A1S7TJF8_9HYPH|nr:MULTISPECIES: hypothetical protein [Agrobacterium]WFS64604.1 hypothetical protein CFBP4996_08575 [Agrobacterium leguminum]CVI54681.1 hypothetical protein AGR7A_Cc120195 [Agrobacterium deltaense NCPPB 1641]
MKKGPRKGQRAAGISLRSNVGQHVAIHPVVATSDLERGCDFGIFSDVPLIRDNESKIRRNFFEERKSASEINKFLRFFAKFVRKYEAAFHTTVPTTAAEVDWSFGSYFVFECHTLASAASKVRLFLRLMTAIGVPSSILPPNPYRDPDPAERDVLDEKKCRSLMKLAKEEAQLVRNRHALACSLQTSGRDPRRSSGAPHGSWKSLENRLWFCREVLQLKPVTHATLIAQGNKSAIAAMEKPPGVSVISNERGAETVHGISAHFRYYHPGLGDLLPFVVMFLIRSMANFQSLADIQASSDWWKPYPFALDAATDDDRYVMIILSKSRGAQKGKVADAPAAVTFPSLKKPQSHPYQILKFVKELTAPLRREICRRIDELRKPELSADEVAELDRLLFIKDDLFIYKTELQITSLRWVAHKLNGPPAELHNGMCRYGITTVRELRDAGLHFSFRASSYNLVILHMLARHSNAATARDYARRRAFFQKSEDLFVAIFDRSVELVRKGKYSLEALKLALKTQGLEDWQIKNILDPETETRWGNRCADPTHPPEGLNTVSSPGTSCASQNCIDGCKWARFLPDSLTMLVQHDLDIAHQLDNIGAAKEIQNTLSQRQKNLRRILAAFPQRAVDRERHRLSVASVDQRT